MCNIIVTFWNGRKRTIVRARNFDRECLPIRFLKKYRSTPIDEDNRMAWFI